MNFFHLTLGPRLLLASLPVIVAPWLYWLAERLFPDATAGFGFLWYAWTPPFHDILFGLLVLAPFINASHARTIRILALVVVAVAVNFAAVFTVVNTQEALDWGLDSRYLRFATVVPTALVATWLLAAATAWIAPLRVSRRYWCYTGLAGLVAGLVFLTTDIIDATGPYGDWMAYAPWWIWPVSTCAAIYCGRDRDRTG